MENNDIYPFTIFVVLGYIVGHLLWIKVVKGDYSLAFFRCIFIAVLCGILVLNRQTSRIKIALIGEGTFSRKDMPDLIVYLSIIVFLRIAWMFVFEHSLTLFTRRTLFDNCILAPINEEIVFRGVILGCLLYSFSGHKWRSIIVSSLIFYVFHEEPFSIKYFVALFVSGLLLGHCYYRLRNVIPCIALHIVWNSLSFIQIPSFFNVPDLGMTMRSVVNWW